ncbi:MAG: VWA domain-containing protein [Oscillospiraceae bacterium]|nr:VWA domain-containing protein [Oscillospiraceae bacterium]
MKKFRKTALFMAICLTAVFYAACGSGNYEANYAAPAADNSYNANPSKSQSAQNAVAGAPIQEFADAEYAYEDGGEDFYNYNNEEYAQIVENGFINTADENTSTFSVDVDTASYSNVRRMIQDGYYDYIPEAVRIEEMINYFSYDYPAPEDDSPFSVTTELSPCPWNENNQLMLVGLQADKIDLTNRAPMNLVFLIDVSGSMYGEDRLGLVQKAVNMLAENLNANDRVSIVTYAGYESVVLEGAPGNDTQTITNAISNLEAGGSTAGEAGIKKAYEIAEKYFIQNGNNRVLLATDGDLNVGISSAEELKALVEKERDTGVHLSVLGFGYGNLKDERLETLADNGNGNYSYIDSELEAKKVLVQEMGGTLYTVAKDVKLQLEFDPETVQSYRLIGYENRVLANEDFNNDKVDAGEIGAGHSVTALYELVPANTPSESGHIMKLAMRYKAPDGDQSLYKEFEILKSSSWSDVIQKNEAFASAVTEFGMLLRNSEYAGTASYSQIMSLLDQSDLNDEYKIQFAELVEEAYYAGLLPDSVSQENAPVPEQNQNPDSQIQEETQNTAVSAGYDFTMTVYHNGSQEEMTDPASFVSLVEMYLDSDTVLDEVPDGLVESEAQQSGIYVDISYLDAYQKDGKMLTFKNSGDVFKSYGLTIVITDEKEWLIINDDGYRNVYALPKVMKDELMLRLKMAEQS